MEAFVLTCQMDKKSHFRAQLDILYRAAKHAIILFASVLVLFLAVFAADCVKNGGDYSWGITRTLLFCLVAVTAMVGVYLIYSPIHAYLKAVFIARDENQLKPYTVMIGKDKITVEGADGSVKHYSWFNLRVYRETKRFVILRDRLKKNQTGQIILPKTDISKEQIEEILTYREDVVRAEEIKKNPVARERARQEKLTREKRGAVKKETPVEEVLTEMDAADKASLDAAIRAISGDDASLEESDAQAEKTAPMEMPQDTTLTNAEKDSAAAEDAHGEKKI